jgi:cell division protease FtsH
MNTIPEANPIHKVTIVPRGLAGGYTLALPEDDITLMSRNKMVAEMIGLMGGRAAEQLVFDDYTSGASNDIERITAIARAMVTRYGMSDEMGPMVYGKKDEMIFLGREISEQRDYSEAVAEKIDDEVRALVTEAYQEAKSILVKYRSELDAVAERLIEVETLSRGEFEKIFPPPVKKRSGTPVLMNGRHPKAEMETEPEAE